MGRTLKTTNQQIIDEIAAFSAFRDALSAEYKPAFDDLMVYARRHVAAISMANHALPFEVALLAMLIEVQHNLRQLESGQLIDGDDTLSGLVLRHLPPSL